ncbi:hypothetical protein C8F01DRAFT_1249749 [Mycena amicta]|nr:hypothetical protein C8F01DRAFT_1249749 [Mycena amicta]
MPGLTLPYELIAEILSPLLDVPDELFASCVGSPFSTYGPSSANYLLVCKSWLHAGTPLLYRVLIIRSRDQAKALARTFSQPHNSHLGNYVRNLRIESGYGTSIKTILACSPKITHLNLTLDVWPPDTVDPTSKGLKLINPTALMLQHHGSISRSPRTKMVTQLANGIADAIPGWTRLTTLHYDSIGMDDSQKISRPLVDAKRLTTLFVSSTSTAHLACKLLANTCPLEVIYITQAPTARKRNWLNNQPVLRQLVKFQIEPSPVVLPPVERNPFYIPMDSATEEDRKAVWSRVLFFAMFVQERALDVPNLDLPPLLPFLHVSKLFYKLALPHLLVHIKLAWRGNSTGMDTEASFQLTLANSHPVETISNGQSYIPMSWRTFTLVAQRIGWSLQQCDLRTGYNSEVDRDPMAVNIFRHFVELRTLVWNCLAEFKPTGNNSTLEIEALPKLSHLRIVAADQTFLDLLSTFRLPSLKTLLFVCKTLQYEPFLRAHGSTLVELELQGKDLQEFSVPVLELCPCLTKITIESSLLRFYDADNLFPRVQNRTLVKFCLMWGCRIVAPKNYNAWETLITTFDTNLLPSLKEIELVNFEWPRNQRLINDSPFIHWADLLRKRGIHLLDRRGKRWRTRYKFEGG